MAKLSNDGTYVIVEKGDTLSEIAEEFLGSSSKYKELATLNNLPNANLIVIGQKIKLSGAATTESKTTTNRVTIEVFGLQSNTDRTMYATWSWTRSNTEHYQVIWYYDTGDGVWFIGNDSTVKDKQSTYSAPSNAKRVKFKVKPVSKTYTVNKKETVYWTADWSTEQTYDFSNNPPATPPTPDVDIEDYTLTAEVDNLDVNATHIEFQVVKNNEAIYKSGKVKISYGKASFSCTVDAGGEYKVRCRSIRDKQYSGWSAYSGESGTPPAAPSGFTECKAMSETSVYLEWGSVDNATGYELEYTTEKRYFDGSDQTTKVSGIEFNHYEKTGLEMGDEYFFRVRAVNDDGESAWTDIVSVVIGKKPAAPTTWSSTTTVVTGEQLTLYWVHNAEDNSSETFAEVELNIGGTTKTYTIEKSTDENEKNKTSSYTVDTKGYLEGVKILWRVRTAGITKTYGDWSVQRTVDIYAPATLEFRVTNPDGDSINTLEMFPFYVYALGGPKTQTPIGYHLTIKANETYETVDNIGNKQIVNKGEEVYSKYFDITSALTVEMSANNVDLENNISYTVACAVSMNSGLTAEASAEFIVAWTDVIYEPNAEIGLDAENFTTFIRPFCIDENENLIEGVGLAVYRREFDGDFTELAKNIDNLSYTFITDPHPSLDYARYRIVATDTMTGAVSYYDPPGFPIGGTAVIIQWDEDWSSFNVSSEDKMEQPSWSGSLLKLPYNIDVSDNNKIDVALVEYIGRSHPVSYYGTQLGVSSTWNVVIPKEDKETLYALRRLAKWMGNVYVREPSGSGYWASISVSFSQKHCDVTIPVTLNVTRVEGGA